MDSNISRYALMAIKIVASLAFLAAGLAKLASVDMMVATFEAVGVGQWFRYVTGIIEISGAVLLWLPGKQFYGAALLAVTMLGAVASHILILGTATMGPAVLLLALTAYVAYHCRSQMQAG